MSVEMHAIGRDGVVDVITDHETAVEHDVFDLRSGWTKGATVLPERQAVPPLQLAGEPHIAHYETVAPDGTIVEVIHNIDTGHTDYTWTTRRAHPLPAGDETT